MNTIRNKEPDQHQLGGQGVDQAAVALADTLFLPQSLCGGAKWSNQRRNVGSWHQCEVVGTAGEELLPGTDKEKTNKMCRNKILTTDPADEYSYKVNQT